MAITLADFSKIWASTSPLTPYSFTDANYQEGWNFVGSTPPARQMWDGYMKFSDEKQQYIVNNFLPLSGGTMTGAIEFKVGVIAKRETNDSYLQLNSGTETAGGSSTILCGKSYTGSYGAGSFVVNARNDSDGNKALIGKADGTFTWNGQTIQTSSDKRLKQDFSDVPADVLDAWSRVNWKQFKFKADVEKKGDSCRWHTGLVAQDVADVSEDLLKYGILCHDVREADEDNDAVDLWTIRYEEALAMEVIYLRKEIAKLKTEIESLKK